MIYISFLLAHKSKLMKYLLILMTLIVIFIFKDLEKKLHLTTQSYSRQLRSEQIKHKQCKQELQELKDRCSNVELRLKVV